MVNGFIIVFEKLEMDFSGYEQDLWIITDSTNTTEF